MLARLLALTTLLLAMPASACMCWIETPEASRERAASVFDGVVVAKRVIVDNDPHSGFMVLNEYEFATIRIWKGQPERRIVVRGGTACANEFSGGRRYVVYTSRRHDSSLTNMPCGPTAAFDVLSKFGDVEERFGAPLARFDPPASLPGAAAASWYMHRANLMVGLGLLARLTNDPFPYTDEVRTAATGIAVTGVLTVVVLLIGAATNFRRKKRALLLLAIAGVVAVAMLAAAGRVFLSYPANSISIRWQDPQG